MAFFSDIAKKFGLIPELIKQELKTAESEATAKRLVSQLQAVQKPQVKPTQPVSFFGDIAKRFNLIKPQEFISPKVIQEPTPIQRAVSDMTTQEKWTATGNLTKELILMFPQIVAKVGVSLVQAPITLGTLGKKVPEPVKVPKLLTPILGEEVSSYAKNVERSIQGGVNPIKATLLTGLFATWDVLIAGSLLKFGARMAVKGIKAPETAQWGAWESLGRPATQKEAKITYRQLSHTLHPDKPTGSTDAFVALNNAYKIIEKQGIPKIPPQPLRIIRDIAEALNMPVSEIMKTKSAQPFLGVKGYLPGEAVVGEPQPAMGLSIKPVKKVGGVPEVPKVAKELEPLAEEVRKYGSEEEFVKKIDLYWQDRRAMGGGEPYAEASINGKYAGAIIDSESMPIPKTARGLSAIPEQGKYGVIDSQGKAVGVFDTEAQAEKALKSQLTDFYNQVRKGKEIIPTKRPPSLEKLGLREKAPLITRREDVLLRARIRNEARGAKIGAIEARRLTREELITKFKDSQENVRQIKNDLIKYINENLPTEARGKLTQSLVRDNLTRKNAASIFSRVERIKETLTRKELISDIKKLSVPKGSLAVDYQKQIAEIVSGIDPVKPTEVTLKKLKGLRDFIQKEGTPLNIQSKYIEKLDRLIKKNINQLTTEELAELNATLNQLQKLGKLKQSLKYKYNERERKVALDKLLASTNNIDPKVSGELTKLDTYKVGTKKIYMDTLHTPRVADMIDGFKGYQGENAKLIKELGAKETEAKEITRATIDSALKEIQNSGIEELTKEQQLNIMIDIRNREGAFDQVKTLLEKNGLKEIPKLTDQENQVIEIIKKHTNQYTDDIVAVFEEIENIPFTKLEEYILPIKYEKEFNLIPSQTIEQGRYRTTQTFKGFTFERQKGVEKTPRTDILAIFEEAINSQQWYLKMQPELENIKYLVKSDEYLAKGGEMASNWWKNELDVVARRGWSATAQSNQVLKQARINLNQAILGYKISSILMQPFAVFDAMAYSQSRYGTMATLKVLKEFSKAWIVPKYAKNIISESPALQLRQAGELAIEETLKKVGKAKGLWNSFIRGGMSLLQKADVITAAGVEKGLSNVLEKHGVPNAKQEAEFLMNMVSGSNEVVYRPHILASGEGARTWFTFQTFFLNRWGIMIHDLIRSGIIKGGGEIGWKGLWKRISALIGLGIFVAGSIAENQSRKVIYETTTGKKLPDESMAKTAMMFIPTQIPYFGNIIEVAGRGGNANPPVIRTVENVFSGGMSVIKGVKPETKIKGALRMTEAGITLGTGIPGTAQFFDLMEKIFLSEEKKIGVGKGGPSLSMPSLKMPSLKMPSLKQ